MFKGETEPSVADEEVTAALMAPQMNRYVPGTLPLISLIRRLGCGLLFCCFAVQPVHQQEASLESQELFFFLLGAK